MKVLYLLVFTLLLSLSTTKVVEAASLYLDPARDSLNRGDGITVAIRVNVDESSQECVNAADIVLKYSDNIIVEDVSIGRSIFPIWVEYPNIDKDERKITMAGGIPNGYCGRVAGDPQLTNVIAEVVLRVPGLRVGASDESDVATINFGEETTLYLHDGIGTKANLNVYNSEFKLSRTIGSDIRDNWGEKIQNDTLPPEPFSIELNQGDLEFNGQNYVIFNTTDKQTGISHYEVIEEAPENLLLFLFGAATTPWKNERSPYVLEDQSLRSTIRVKAVDKAGNEYIATLPPQNAGTNWTLYIIFAGLGLLSILLISGMLWYLIRLVKSRKVDSQEYKEDKTDEII